MTSPVAPQAIVVVATISSAWCRPMSGATSARCARRRAAGCGAPPRLWRRAPPCRVGLITGFFVPLGAPPAAETDGPVGAALAGPRARRSRHSLPARDRRALPQRLRGRARRRRRRRGAGRLRSRSARRLAGLIETWRAAGITHARLDRALRAQQRRQPAQHARHRHQRRYGAARRTLRGRAVADDRGRRRRQRDRDGRPAARADRPPCRARRDDRLRHPGKSPDRRRRVALGRLRTARRARRRSRRIGARTCCAASTRRSTGKFSKRPCATGRRSTAYRACRRRRSTISILPFTTENADGPRPRRGWACGLRNLFSRATDTTRPDGSLSLRYRFLDGPRFEERLVFDFPPRRLAADAEDGARPDLSAGLFVVGRQLLQGLCAGDAALRGIPARPRHRALSAEISTKRASPNSPGETGFRCRVIADSIGTPPTPPAPSAIDLPRRTCVPVGGGKDSIVTLECLKAAGEDLVLFSLGDAEPIAACIAASGLPSIRVRRRLDPGLLTLNEQGALNGHVPITGILSAIVLACAVLAGFDTIAMSNEHSASAPNLTIGGVGINHQYSKSLEFERDFADYIARHITPSIAYFSLLRPLSEIEIARRFARYPQYFGIFRSCNTAFRQSPAERGRHWCCNCPKCRFVFLALAPSLPKRELIAIFGRDMLDDESPNRRVCRIVRFARAQAVRVRRRNRRKCGGDGISRELTPTGGTLPSCGGCTRTSRRCETATRRISRPAGGRGTRTGFPHAFLAKLDACG